MLAKDIQGFPNGRRLTDDVLDITLQAAAGILKGANVSTLGDGVDRNDVPFRSTFPYLAFPHSGGNPWKLNPKPSSSDIHHAPVATLPVRGARRPSGSAGVGACTAWRQQN